MFESRNDEVRELYKNVDCYSVDTLKNALAMAGFRVDTSGVIPVRSPGEPMDAFYLQATNC
ncbi:hypothetical protein [Vibrio alginolyticus]|uniref:hypothetical protein n=1 Tax=Vibrio alginolyticus TaxID=663 RepID=UPI002FF16571